MIYAPHHIALETFVGRATALDEVSGLATKGESWSLSAGRRIGKTMFLRELAVTEQGHTLWVYIDKQELPEIAAASAFFGYLVASTWNRLPGAQSSPAPATVQELADLVLEVGADGRSWCLLLDEADSLVQQPWGGSALENIRWLVSNSPAARFASVGVVGGMSLVRRLRSAGSSISNVCRPLTLVPLDDPATAQLIRLGFPDARRDLVNAMRTYAGGHPYLAQLFLSAAETSGWPIPSKARELLEDELERRTVTWLGDLSEPARNEVTRAAMSGGAIDANADELIRGGVARPQGSTTSLNSPALRRAVLAASADSELPRGPTGGSVRPGHPYSNKRVFREILESAQSDIRWLDNYAGLEILDLLADADLAGVSVRVLGGIGDDAVRARLLRRLPDLHRELDLKGVALAWREAHPQDLARSHDRYLIADDLSYNIPPVSSVVRERRADVTLGTMSVAEFDGMWVRGISISG
jgi:hypothetical protein